MIESFGGALRTSEPMMQAMGEAQREPDRTPSAQATAERLLREIHAFESELDERHEVGVRLVSFGQALHFHLGTIGYAEPALIVLEGVSDREEPVRLVQHVSQISILLTGLPRRDTAAARRAIGLRAEP